MAVITSPWFVAFCVHAQGVAGVAAEPGVTTISVDVSAGRDVPRFGFGNELVLQSTNDSKVAAALKGSGGTITRYPGGTPSDYWKWDQGWISPNSPCSESMKCTTGNYPERQTTPAQWRSFLDKSAITDSVLDLCQMTCNLTYELAGLRAHAAAGTPIKFVELGNEMYDSTRADVMAKYPQPRDYADAMLPWIDAIKKEWPEAQVALVGERWNEYHNPREDAWNEQVLQSSAGAKADAATLHIYCGWRMPALMPTSLATLLSLRRVLSATATTSGKPSLATCGSG